MPDKPQHLLDLAIAQPSNGSDSIKSSLNMSAVNLALATLCLLARVEETKRKSPIFQDWEAIRIWEEMQECSELIFSKSIYELYNWRSQTAIAIRSQIFDEVVKEHLLSHRYPVVIELGCGFSTRSLRFNQSREYLWYEVDKQDVIAIKKRHVGKAPSHLVSADVANVKWLKDVFNWIERVNPDSSVIFVAEGLFMYFDEKCVNDILHCLAEAFPGSTIVFDGMSDVYSRSAKSSSLPIKWLAAKSKVDFTDLHVRQRWNLLQLYPKRWKHWQMLSCFKSFREADFIVKGNLGEHRQIISQQSLANTLIC